MELVGPTKLVLEKCGTEVDDDEVLEEIADEVLLLLADGETYTPSVAQQIPDSTRSLVACTTGDVLQPSRSASDNEMASTSSSGTEAYASHKSSNTLCKYVITFFIVKKDMFLTEIDDHTACFSNI